MGLHHALRPVVRPRLAAAVLVAALAVVAQGCASSGDQASRPTTTAPAAGSTTTATASSLDCHGTGTVATHDVRYRQVAGVDPDLLSLDYYRPVRAPGCGPAPIVVYVHGGGFRIGDKARKMPDKVKLFNDEGWVFASVDYRLSPQPPWAAPGEVRYPTQEQDAAAAVAWLHDHTSAFGGDPSRISLIGHSSGAFIVSLLGTDTSFLEQAGSTPPRSRAWSPSTPSTTSGARSPRAGPRRSSTQHVRRRPGRVEGGLADGAHRRRRGPTPLLDLRAGAKRRTAQAAAFAEALVEGGTPARSIDVNPLDHEGIDDAVGRPGDTVVTPPLMAFLRTCARPASS
ncbi:alpha/beta hydrolase [Aquihabitans sp. McL0605]|uniref:alpha/beta hydrolase n=1 Tax=Aquihabitans sp. McL0605 TaxID=3415671 RepID=UPI003CEE4BDA